jgi:hypothetical protein
VAFRKPIVLPAAVAFAEQADRTGIRFGVRDPKKGSGHLDGQVNFG